MNLINTTSNNFFIKEKYNVDNFLNFLSIDYIFLQL